MSAYPQLAVSVTGEHVTAVLQYLELVTGLQSLVTGTGEHVTAVLHVELSTDLREIS